MTRKTDTSTDTKPFQLRELVIDILTAESPADYHAIVPTVIAKIADADVRDALAQALPAYIQPINNERSRIARGDRRPMASMEDDDEFPGYVEPPSATGCGTAAAAPQPWGAGKSRFERWHDKGSAYIEFMKSSLPVTATGVPKHMHEATPDDLAATIEYRNKLTRGMLISTQRIDFLRRKVIEAGVATVGELDEATVLEIIRWQPDDQA